MGRIARAPERTRRAPVPGGSAHSSRSSHPCHDRPGDQICDHPSRPAAARGAAPRREDQARDHHAAHHRDRPARRHHAQPLTRSEDARVVLPGPVEQVRLGPICVAEHLRWRRLDVDDVASCVHHRRLPVSSLNPRIPAPPPERTARPVRHAASGRLTSDSNHHIRAAASRENPATRSGTATSSRAAPSARSAAASLTRRASSRPTVRSTRPSASTRSQR